MPHAAFTRTETAAALAIGTLAVLMLGLQPILLGELVEARQVTLEGVGLVAMAEIVAIGLGVVLGDALLPVARLRAITLLAALGAAAFDLATVGAHGDAALLAVRAGAGIAQGVLVWGTTAVIVRSAQPAWLGGVFFVVQTLAQAAVGALLANVVIPRAGWQGGFTLLAALSLLPLALAFAQPAGLAALAPARHTGFAWSARTVLPLVVVFLQLSAIGCFWAYLEPLGQAAGFDARGAQTLVASVLVLQVLGGLAGTWAVRRLNVRTTLLGGALLLAATLALLHELPPGATRGFALGGAVFGFLWLFMLPFQIGLAFHADPSGRLASLVPAAQLLGSAFGPLVASLLVQGDDAGAVPLLGAGFAVVAAALLPLLRRGASVARPVLE